MAQPRKRKKQNVNQGRARNSRVEAERDIYRKILLFGWMGLLLLLPFLASKIYAVYSAPKFFVSLIVIVLLSSIAVIGIIRNKLLLLKTSWIKPLIFYSVVFVAATIFSTDPHISLFGAYPNFHTGLISYILCVSFFFVVLSSRPSVDEIKQYLKWFVFAGVIISIYSIFDRFSLFNIGDSQILSPGRAIGIFGNSDYTFSYLIFILPLIFYFFLQEKNRILKGLYIPAILLFLAGLFFLLPNNIQAMAFGVFKTDQVQQDNIVSNAGGQDEGVGEVSNESSNKKTSFLQETANGQRFWAWNAGIKIGREHLLLGTGPATVSYYLPAINKENPTKAWYFGSKTDNLHSEIIDNYAMMGVLGLFGYLLLWGSLLFYIMKGIKQDNVEKSFLVAISTSMMLYLGFNQLFFSTVGTMFLPWLAAAVILILVGRVNYFELNIRRSSLKTVGICLVLAMTSFVLFWGFRYWLADFYYGKSTKTQGGFVYAEKAVGLFPYVDVYWRSYGYNLYYYCLVYNPKVNNLILEDQDKKTVLLTSAEALERAVSIKPRDTSNLISYGYVLLNMKTIDPEYEKKASGVFARAIAVDSDNNPITYMRIADAYETVNDFDREKMYLDKAQLLIDKKPRPLDYAMIVNQLSIKYADMDIARNNQKTSSGE